MSPSLFASFSFSHTHKRASVSAIWLKFIDISKKRSRKKTTKKCATISQLIDSSQIERYICVAHVCVYVTIKPLIGGGKKSTKMAFLHVNTKIYLQCQQKILCSIHSHLSTIHARKISVSKINSRHMNVAQRPSGCRSFGFKCERESFAVVITHCEIPPI